jgi:hypothetical protein
LTQWPYPPLQRSRRYILQPPIHAATSHQPLRLTHGCCHEQSCRSSVHGRLRLLAKSALRCTPLPVGDMDGTVVASRLMKEATNAETHGRCRLERPPSARPWRPADLLPLSPAYRGHRRSGYRQRTHLEVVGFSTNPVRRCTPRLPCPLLAGKPSPMPSPRARWWSVAAQDGDGELGDVRPLMFPRRRPRSPRLRPRNQALVGDLCGRRVEEGMAAHGVRGNRPAEA